MAKTTSPLEREANAAYPMLPPDPLLLDFREVIQLIGDRGSAPWLHEFMVDFNTPLWLARVVDQLSPTRKEIVARYNRIANSAEVLRLALDDPNVDDVFKLAGLEPASERHPFGTRLENIARLAKDAALSLTTARGTVKPGRGRATTNDMVSQFVFCAVVIVEAWKHLHGKYPAARNDKAQEAAALYWKLSDGERAGHSPDARKSWRGHIAKAIKEPAVPRVAAFRSEVRRHLVESEGSHALLTAKGTDKPTI